MSSAWHTIDQRRVRDDWNDWKESPWSQSDWYWKADSWSQEKSWSYDKNASWSTGPQRPVSCRDWGQGWSEPGSRGNSTWPGNPVSCRNGGESGSACGSQDNPSSYAADRLKKWALVEEEDNQAPPQPERLGGAPEAARRWLASDAYKLGIETTSAGATAHERTEQHRDHALLADVSCRDVSGVSCGDADPPNDAGDSDGYDAAFFRSYAVNRHYSDHSTVLKWAREVAEGGGVWGSNSGGELVMANDELIPIPYLVRKPDGGEEFDFDRGGVPFHWTWECMIAHLNDESIDFVVNGADAFVVNRADAPGAAPPSDACSSGLLPSNDSWSVIRFGSTSSSADHEAGPLQLSRGDLAACTVIVPYRSRSRRIVGCELVVSSRIDHKRHVAAKKGKVKWPDQTKPMYCWDFMVKRNDGTVCLIHPNFSNNKVSMYEGVTNQNIDVPQNGLGGSNGHGTYKKRITDQVTRQLRFDGRKSPQGVRPAVRIMG